ncbi:DUF3305 domain-containing protein [Caenispirillum bisanense]
MTMSMDRGARRSRQRFPVGVVVERRPARSRWLDHVLTVTAVLPGAVGRPSWSELARLGDTVQMFAGTVDIHVHPGDTRNYKDNLEAPQPKVYVVLRRGGGGPSGWRLLLATVDPAEAQSHAECGDDLLEALPMPAPVRDWLAEFVARNHVERPRWKRRRDDADPEALAPRRRPHADGDRHGG